MPETKPGILRSLYNKVMGVGTDPLSTNNAEQWPALAASWAGRQHEMPNEASQVNKIRPMNFIERAIHGPTSQAATYPWGTIAINRPNVEANKVNLDNLLVHELTHVGQRQKEGLFGVYSRGGSRNMPDYEQEAYDAENNRYKKARLTNIPLPSSNPRAIKKTYSNLQN